MRGLRAAVAAALAGLLLLAGVELVHWWASRQALPRRRGAVRPGVPGPEVVLVLGHPARRSGALHPMQQWRTDIAVRSVRSDDARLVFSGTARDGGPSEAEGMAGYARDVLGVPADRIVCETRATSTWENVACSLGELEQAGTIRIASSPVHAARARRYLARQRPDLAARLAPADDHRFGQRWGWKLASLGYQVGRALVRGCQKASARGRPGARRAMA